MSVTKTLFLLTLVYLSVTEGTASIAQDNDDSTDDDDGPPPQLIFLNTSLQCTVGCQNTDGTHVTVDDINKQLMNAANLPKGAACVKIRDNSAGFLKSSCLGHCKEFVKKLLGLSAGSDACDSSKDTERLKKMQAIIQVALEANPLTAASGHKSEVKSLVSTAESSKVTTAPVSGVIVVGIVGVTMAVMATALAVVKHRRGREDERAQAPSLTPNLNHGNSHSVVASL